MEIFKEFVFDAAHFNPAVPDSHRCRRMHGHTYRVTLFLSGEPDERLGWVCDFGDVKSAMGPILKRLDHSCLNEIEGLEQPTCEMLAVWIWKQLKDKMPLLSKITIRESDSSGVTFVGTQKTSGDSRWDSEPPESR